MRTLTPDETAQFARDGLLIKRSYVPTELIDRANTLIDQWSRHEMDPRQIQTYTQRSFAPEIEDHPDLLSLFTASGLRDLALDLVGDIEPVSKTQVQIRLPTGRAEPAQPEKPMHVDGVACPHLDPTELRTFTLLVGVMLTDTRDPACGALRYVPGGHLDMATWFRSEWSRGMTDEVPPYIDALHGVPFLGKRGDALLMHHLVPHAAGTNTTPAQRVMAYFRISHVDHRERKLTALRDPWLDYPGVRPAEPAHIQHS